MMCDTVLTFDHVTHTMKIISHVRLDQGVLEANYASALENISAALNRLRGPLPSSSVQAPAASSSASNKIEIDWETMSNTGKEGYEGPSLIIFLSEFQNVLGKRLGSWNLCRCIPVTHAYLYLRFR
jgi:hypothetical protein